MYDKKQRFAEITDIVKFLSSNRNSVELLDRYRRLKTIVEAADASDEDLASITSHYLELQRNYAWRPPAKLGSVVVTEGELRAFNAVQLRGFAMHFSDLSRGVIAALDYDTLVKRLLKSEVKKEVLPPEICYRWLSREMKNALDAIPRIVQLFPIALAIPVMLAIVEKVARDARQFGMDARIPIEVVLGEYVTYEDIPSLVGELYDILAEELKDDEGCHCHDCSQV